MKLPKLLILPVLLGFAGAQAFLPYPERQLKYPRLTNWDTKTPALWSGWKSRFLAGGIVQGNDPNGTKRPISEGQSYGLLMAVWMGDRATFNTIWSATENEFWRSDKGWYGWLTKTSGQAGGENFAGDADIDIAGALIFASALVDSGYWQDYTVGGNNYKAKAKIVLKSVMDNFIDKNANYRVNSWPNAGEGIRNPSYHMPQWYPIFKEFAAANGMSTYDWDAATKGAYDFLEAQPNAQFGVARNFSSNTGGSPNGGTSSPNNYDMGFDAIRVPYRIGMAAMWYNQARAITYAGNVWKNATPTKGVSAKAPGMYRASDATLWGWTDGGYEKFLSRSMWGTLAQGSRHSSALAAAKADSIVGQITISLTGQNFIAGEDSDTTQASSANKNYYAQSLGLLGVLAMSGRAWNVWDDLKHKWTVPDTAAQVVGALAASPASMEVTPVGGTAVRTKITATLSKPVRWTLRLTGRTSGARYDSTATSSTILSNWASTMRVLGTTARFTNEVVDVRLVYPGGDTTRASQRATITLTPSTGVKTRAVRGDGTVRHIGAGWLVQDIALAQGVWTKATIRNLQGRVLRSVSLGDAAGSEAGLLVPSPADAVPTLMEIESGSGLAPRRYLLRPSL